MAPLDDGRPQDPHWSCASASLRDGVLFLKLPTSKARLLVLGLQGARRDLLRKKLLVNRHSLCALGPVQDWREDLRVLQELPRFRNPTVQGVVQEVIRAIEGGLRADPDLDWIARVGGPAKGISDLFRLPTPDPGLELLE